MFSNAIASRALCGAIAVLAAVLTSYAETAERSRIIESIESEEDLFNWVVAWGLTQSETKAAYTEWIKAQNPLISPEQLSALHCSKRDSLVSGCYSYSLRIHPGESDERDFAASCAFSGEKLMFDLRSGAPGELGAGYRKAYDGTSGLVKTYWRETDTGQLETFFRRDEFVQDIGDPLTLMMLRSTSQDFGQHNQPIYQVDLEAFLSRAYLQEGLEIVNGTPCLVALLSRPPICKVYLDPDKNFALVRRESVLNEKTESGVYVGRKINARLTTYAPRDFGNGVWLPDLFVRENVVGPPTPGLHQELVRYFECSVDQMQLNARVENTVFTDVIPHGILVFDKANDLLYRDIGSIEEAEDILNEALFTLSTETDN